ncbi:hypothetical protein CBA19CS22_00680 [Caballeronia novacaledonica]|uniref:Uncharacterized protein n=1 Tax=Caballeronia novacaledonica TaxID=1544861 RepID=A0ACB5QK51_9BURK|nr:hypothetical protein CBA19CS22_00680 [Caballeronia novacaledonica]
MTEGKTSLLVELPIPEAGELAALAASLDVSTQKYLGYHVLRSAYGQLHPEVAAFEVAHVGKRGE